MAAASANPNDPDAIMLAQVDYWKTHKATTTAQVQQKVQAYAYANDHGIKGARWPDYDEMKLEPNQKTSLNTKNLGAGLSVLATGAAGLAGGPAAGIVAGAAAAPIIAGSEAQHVDFGGAPTAPAASYLRGGGSLSDPTMPGSSLSDPALPPGYGAGGGSQPAVAKSDPSNGAWDAFVPAGGIPATGGGTMATPAYAPQSGSTGNPYLDMVLHNAQATQTTNQGIVTDQVLPAIKQQKDVNSQVGQNLGANLTAENGMIGGYQTGNNGLIQQGYDASGAFIGQNDAALQQYQTTMGGFSQLAATPYQGDWVSNPNDVAQQQSSYNTLSGIGAGSLDYQAAQASLTQAGYSTANLTLAQVQQAALALAKYKEAASNPGDVQGEQDALAQLQSVAGGSLDVVNGSNSPEAYHAQLSALSQMGDLTNPQKTSQEEFLYEQQRQREVQDESATRAAHMASLRQRGMSGSGLELTDQLGSDQINSQNRLLGDLGTQATAVARATANLGNYGNLSSEMVGQGNQVGMSNAQNRLTAAAGQGQLASDIRGQGDAMNMFNANAYNTNQYQNAQMTNQNEMFNADSKNQASIVNANSANNISEFNANAYNQNQQFNSASANENSQFNANATNTASANNQSTRVQGSVAAGTQAANMRAASDAVGLANSAQQGISNRANDTFRAQQQTDAAARAKTLVDTTQGTATTDLNSKTNAINAASLLKDKSLAAGFKGTDDTASYWKTLSDLGQQNTTNALAFGGLSTGVNTQGQQTLSSALLPAAGNATANGALQLLGKSPYTYA